MSNTLQTDLILDLSSLLAKIQKRMAGALSPHGISFTEYMVLRQLTAAPANKMRRIDLAENIGLSASGITRLLNPMEKIGLVMKEENARDARVSLVALTDAGKRIFNETDAAFGHAAQALFAPIDKQDIKAMSTLIRTLV